MQIDTEKAIVPNWFYKKNLEEMTGEKLTQEEFEAFRLTIESSSYFADKLSEEIAGYFYEWREELRSKVS